MTVGLIAVLGVGSVLATGEEVEEVYCVAVDSLREALYGTPPRCLQELSGGGVGEQYVVPLPGVEDGDFVDLTLPPTAFGPQRIVRPVPDDIDDPAGYQVRIVPSGSPVGGCAGAFPDLTCGAPDTVPTTVTLAPDDTHYGYVISPPEDPRSGFADSVTVELLDTQGNVVETAEVDIDRPAGSIILDPDFEFVDEIFPEGTTTDQLVMVDLEGDFNGPMRWQMDNTEAGSAMNGARYEPCMRDAGGALVCTSGSPTSSSARSVNVDPTAQQVGYRISNFPNDPRILMESRPNLRLFSRLDTGVSAEWTIDVMRTPTPTIVDLGGGFTIMKIPIGTTDNQAVWLPTTGSTFTGPMRFLIDQADVPDAGGLRYETCMRAAGGAVTCGAREYSQDSVLTSVPADVAELGYRISSLPASSFEEAFTTLDITLESEIDPSVAETWQVSVLRTPQPIVFTPSFDFTDQAFAEGTTTDTFFWQSLTGSFNAEMTFEMNSTNSGNNPEGLRYEACVRRADNSVECGSRESVGRRSDIPDVQPDDQAVGYRISGFDPDTREPQDVDVRVRLGTNVDSTNNREDWNITISRDAAPVVFSPTFTFPDITVPAGQTTYEEVIPISGSFNGHARFLIEETTGGFARYTACWRAPDGTRTCGSQQFSGHSFIDVPMTQADALVVQFEWSNPPNPFDETMRMRLRDLADSSQRMQRDVSVTRN